MASSLLGATPADRNLTRSPPVCAPTATGWTPHAFPPGAGFFGKRSCTERADFDFDRLVPVTHQLNSLGRRKAHGLDLDAHFYYYARGCSDMYIRTGRTLLAANRFGAAVQLVTVALGLDHEAALAHVTAVLAPSFGPSLCGLSPKSVLRMLHGLDSCGAVAPAWPGGNATAVRAWRVLQCVYEARLGILATNELNFQMMRMAHIDTLVYLFEAPGAAPGVRLGSGANQRRQRDVRAVETDGPLRPLEWKTEIFRARHFAYEHFIDGDGMHCRVAENSSCVYCEHGSPVLKRACAGETRRTKHFRIAEHRIASHRIASHRGASWHGRASTLFALQASLRGLAREDTGRRPACCARGSTMRRRAPG
jgi:hypothetical protein